MPTDLVTSTVEFENICKVVYHVNQVRTFPLTSLEVVEWSRSIVELIPPEEFDMMKIQFLIKAVKRGEVPWDKDKGIQNIFIGLKYVQKMGEGKYRIVAPHDY